MSSQFRGVLWEMLTGKQLSDGGETIPQTLADRAARIGEQRNVHQLMLDHGVQAFVYGHDPVFVDDVVDGVHYCLNGQLRGTVGEAARRTARSFRHLDHHEKRRTSPRWLAYWMGRMDQLLMDDDSHTTECIPPEPSTPSSNPRNSRLCSRLWGLSPAQHAATRSAAAPERFSG